jgi:hypothetical protein
LGARSSRSFGLIASCLNDACRHQGLIDVSKYRADIEVPWSPKWSSTIIAALAFMSVTASAEVLPILKPPGPGGSCPHGHDKRFLLCAIAGRARCDPETTGRNVPVGLAGLGVVLPTEQTVMVRWLEACAIVVGAALIAAAIAVTNRWQILNGPVDRASGNPDGVHTIFLLDRWSGVVTVCYPIPDDLPREAGRNAIRGVQYTCTYGLPPIVGR